MIPHLRGLRELGDHHDRADAGRRVPRRATAGATTASTCRPPTPPTAARVGLQRLVDAAHARGPRGAARRGLQPRRRLRRAGARGVRPVLHRHVRDAVGQGDELRRRRLRRRPRVGAPERRGLDPRLPLRRPAARRRSTRSSTAAPSTSSQALTARVHALEPARARDRRVRHERPEGRALPRARRLGLRRRLGRRLPPRAARAADRRPRRLLRASSARSAQLAKALPPPARPRRRLLDASARRRFGAPRRRRRRPSASSSSPRTTTRSATARSATACRAEARPLAALCTLLSPFTPMLFQGEEHGERAPFQFFSDHIDEEIAVATREGRRREFAAFAEFARRGGPRPAGPGDVRALQAHARGRAGGPARPLRARCSRRAARSARARRTPSSTSTQGWLRAAPRRAPRARQLLPATPCTCRSTAPVELVLATHHATVEPGYVVLPPLAGALVR